MDGGDPEETVRASGHRGSETLQTDCLRHEGQTGRDQNHIQSNLVFHSGFYNMFTLKIKIKTIYPRGKGPTQELYSSSRRTAVVPLFKSHKYYFSKKLPYVCK